MLELLKPLLGLLVIVIVLLGITSMYGFKAVVLSLVYASFERRAYISLRKHPRLNRVMRDPFYYLMATEVVIGAGMLVLGAGIGLLMYPRIQAWDPYCLTLWLLIYPVLGGVQYLMGVYFFHQTVSPDLFRNDTGEVSWRLFFFKVLSPVLGLVWFFKEGILNALEKDTKWSIYEVPFYWLSQYRRGKLGPMSPLSLKIFKNTLQIHDLEVTDVMVPRNQIQCLDLELPVTENLDVARKSGHSRFPLCRGDLDDCVGIVHIKEVFFYQGDLDYIDLEKFTRKLIVFPETTLLEDAMKKFMKFHIHMALVKNEFGSIVGMLTLEQILEKVVGAIQDEFDYEDEMIREQSEGVYKVSGLAPVHELEEIIGREIPDGLSSTIGGLITSRIGRIPEKHERFVLMGCKVKIDQVTDRQIQLLTLKLPRKRDDEDEGDEELRVAGAEDTVIEA